MDEQDSPAYASRQLSITVMKKSIILIGVFTLLFVLTSTEAFARAHGYGGYRRTRTIYKEKPVYVEKEVLVLCDECRKHMPQVETPSISPVDLTVTKEMSEFVVTIPVQEGTVKIYYDELKNVNEFVVTKGNQQVLKTRRYGDEFSVIDPRTQRVSIDYKVWVAFAESLPIVIPRE